MALHRPLSRHLSSSPFSSSPCFLSWLYIVLFPVIFRALLSLLRLAFPRVISFRLAFLRSFSFSFVVKSRDFAYRRRTIREWGRIRSFLEFLRQLWILFDQKVVD